MRQAIVHAINYTDIAQTVFFGQLSQFVGPEYPAWKQFYDLGNFTPYQTNITLAQAELNSAKISNFPVLNFTVIAGCEFCISTAQIVQADLAQIGINVDIEVQDTTSYYTPYTLTPPKLRIQHRLAPCRCWALKSGARQPSRRPTIGLLSSVMNLCTATGLLIPAPAS